RSSPVEGSRDRLRRRHRRRRPRRVGVVAPRSAGRAARRPRRDHEPRPAALLPEPHRAHRVRYWEPVDRARRYVGWLDRHATAIGVATIALVGISLYLIAFELPLYADLSYLLPQDAPAVRGLRDLEQRVATKDTTIVVVV